MKYKRRETVELEVHLHHQKQNKVQTPVTEIQQSPPPLSKEGKTEPYINQCETHVTPARPSTEQNQRNNDEEQKDEKLR